MRTFDSQILEREGFLSYSDLDFPEPKLPKHRPEELITFDGLQSRFHETAEKLAMHRELPYHDAESAFEQAREWACWGQRHSEVNVVRKWDLARVSVYFDTFRGQDGFEGNELDIIDREYYRVLHEGMSWKGRSGLPTPIPVEEVRYIAALGYVAGLYLASQARR